MHIISRKKLLDFIRKHPDSKSPLESWYKIIRNSSFSSPVDMRRAFPSADGVGKFTVFNIGGNKYRLIAAIHYNRGKVYIRHVLTHRDYDRGDWKKD
ncbi:MAG: type II toxin-antitoxin system HigB family toxin [Leptospiraceae bacterium]|nr:type II toxin-antitoxin system HigB family toxin [Leptospiraceae bacterium]